MNHLFLIFITVGFLAVVLLFEGGYLLWDSHRGTEAKRIQRRLQTLSAGTQLSAESQLIKRRLLDDAPAIEKKLLAMPRMQQLDRILMQSGVSMTVTRFCVLTAVAAASGLFAWMVFPLPRWTALLCVLAAASVPLALVLRSRRIRLGTIEQQLPGALELMSRAMRAGHAFPSAIQMVGAEGPDPIAREFQATFEEVNYGIPMNDALANLAARVPVEDLRYFITAVAVQRETGGNLAELLDKLAALMRARFTLLGTIKVLSAEGRLSGWILSVLPFVLLGAMYLINPKFMSILWKDPAGIIAVYLGCGFMAMGMVWMWRLVKIRV